MKGVDTRNEVQQQQGEVRGSRQVKNARKYSGRRGAEEDRTTYMRYLPYPDESQGVNERGDWRKEGRGVARGKQAAGGRAPGAGAAPVSGMAAQHSDEST